MGEIRVKRRVKSSTGESIEAEVVEFDEISNQPIILKLSDGSILRLKVDIVEVVSCRWSVGSRRSSIL